MLESILTFQAGGTEYPSQLLLDAKWIPVVAMALVYQLNLNLNLNLNLIYMNTPIILKFKNLKIV